MDYQVIGIAVVKSNIIFKPALSTNSQEPHVKKKTIFNPKIIFFKKRWFSTGSEWGRKITEKKIYIKNLYMYAYV